MSVMIGHASIDERGSARGGSAGDQTGREVCTRNWYNKNWLCCIRANDRKVADKIATAMEQACANDKIGYDQNQRTTCYDRAKEVGWNLSKITTACECDCSSLVAVCVNAAGVPVSQHIWTGNEEASLLATGAFKSLRDSKHLTQDAYLARGDILVSNSHTVVVLTNGSKYVTLPDTQASVESVPTTIEGIIKPEAARYFDKAVAGTYKVTASWLNVRAGAGTGKAIIEAIPNGTKVNNYGYYSTFNDTKWLYISGWANDRRIEGFCSSKYLAKQ